MPAAALYLNRLAVSASIPYVSAAAASLAASGEKRENSKAAAETLLKRRNGAEGAKASGGDNLEKIGAA
jgi:hypothetical protein